MKWTTLIKEVVVILLIAVALAGAGYGIRPIIMPRDADPAGGTPVEGEAAIAAITLKDARGRFEAGTALFADARPKRAYTTGHIKGAMHLDPNEFDEWSGDFFSQVPQDQVVIAYCEGAQCQLSIELAEKLTWMGYEKVYYMKNGWGLWKEHQLPIEPLGE